MNALDRRVAWLLGSLLVLIAVGLGLYGLATLARAEDLALVRNLAGQRSAGATAVAHAISWLGRSAVLVPLAIAIALAPSASRRPLRTLAPLVAVLGAVLIQNVDKALIGRTRPPVHELERVSGTSFPSGHATEASAFFVALAVMILAASPSRWQRSLAVASAIVLVGGVALSRVYLGVHYPTDTMAGILLGGTWGAVTARVVSPGASGHTQMQS